MMHTPTIRTRYAPSPTGFQHIGGIRTALFCYLFTRKMGGQFILRIEDTDRARFVPGAEQYILDSLEWCNMVCDESTQIGGQYGPYRQTDRAAEGIYAQYIDQLIETGKAYYAFDTPEELEAMREAHRTPENPSPQYGIATRLSMKNSLSLSTEEVQHRLASGEPYVVRILMMPDREIVVHDLIRGEICINTNEMDDKVLLKSDGIPTYHLANVVDDHLMRITHVIRAEEWLPSTPLHLYLYEAFGWNPPAFAHLPLVLKPIGSGKLSKRDNSLNMPIYPLSWQHPYKPESATGYREMGFLPEAFVNMLAFIGWNPGDDRELFTMPELIESFSLERIHKAGAKFDFDKAKWYNQQYIRTMSNEELAARSRPFAPSAFADIPDGYLANAWALMKERATFLTDIWQQSPYLFAPPTEYDTKTVQKKWKPVHVTLFAELQSALSNLADFSPQSIEDAVKHLLNTQQVPLGEALPLLRIMLAGTTQGPAVFDMIALLGKGEIQYRIGKGVDFFQNILAT